MKNIKLNEADDLDAIEDVITADLDDIADLVQDSVEAESNDKLTVSDQEANETAKEIKTAAKAMKKATLVAIKNDLTECLDDLLRVNLSKQKRTKMLAKASGREEEEFFQGSANLLVTGLPGSGKTAVVKDWARRNNINLVAVDAKNNDLEAWINGYTVKDATQPDKNIITQAPSNNLDGLDKERSVLYLDELNRQVRMNIRGSLYSLINEHVIAGGARYFPNMLFTIATINPSVESDPGATPLSDAERSRFVAKLNFDSNKKAAKSFFKTYYKNLINLLDPEDDDYVSQIIILQKIQDLGLFIVSDPSFRFDDSKDLDDLAGNFENPKDMLNQRSLTDLLEAAEGDVEVFKRLLKKNSNFLPDNIDIILDILHNYEEPSFDKDGNKRDLTKIKAEDEIDTSMFNSTAKVAKSKADAENYVDDFELNF